MGFLNTHVSGSHSRTIINQSGAPIYVVCPTDEPFTSISFRVVFDQCLKGVANLAIGLTSRDHVHSSKNACDNLWYDLRESVMLHLDGLNVSQGEFHFREGIEPRDCHIHSDDVLTLTMTKGFAVFLKVNGIEWGEFHVGPGRNYFCAELRWCKQTLCF